MRPLALAAALVLAAACGHVTKVRPTPKGSLDAEAALGGPLGKVEDLTLPLPLLTAGASWGLTDRCDLDAHVDLTTLYFGVAGLDVGSTCLALPQQGALPALAANARLYGFTDLRGVRAYLELTPSLSWQLGGPFLAYVSGTGFVQFAGGWPLFAVAAGGRAQLGSSGLQLELRW